VECPFDAEYPSDVESPFVVGSPSFVILNLFQDLLLATWNGIEWGSGKV
jgi:hypothetical protein